MAGAAARAPRAFEVTACDYEIRDCGDMVRVAYFAGRTLIGCEDREEVCVVWITKALYERALIEALPKAQAAAKAALHDMRVRNMN